MPRKLYDQQYKLQAVQLAQSRHVTHAAHDGISKTAQSLGINPNMLGRWKRELATNTSQSRPVFTGRGVAALSEQELENQRLRKELEIARQERDILKKAVAFFARESK